MTENFFNATINLFLHSCMCVFWFNCVASVISLAASKWKNVCHVCHGFCVRFILLSFIRLFVALLHKYTNAHLSSFWMTPIKSTH